MWYVRNVLYAMVYVRVSCFVVCGCAVLRRYINVCNCDMFSVVCINGRRYVCCSECNVVSNECYEPTSCFVQPIGSHCCEVIIIIYIICMALYNALLKRCCEYYKLDSDFINLEFINETCLQYTKVPMY